jgi:osmotically inducible protein OsmC
MVEKTASAKWNGNLTEGNGTVTTDTGVLSNSAVSWASRTKESKEQTSPEELMAAAHAACDAMAFSHYLTTNYSAPQSLDVTAKVGFGPKEGGGMKVTHSHLTVTGSVQGMDQATFADAAKKAEAECPVSNAYRGNMEITVDAKLQQ